ncbi:MAG TPA: hypothetical protein VGK29_22480 [Paludibaculum sp.]
MPLNLLFALLLVTGTLRAQEAPVKLDSGNTIQLCGACSSRTIRAAVTTTGFSIAKGERPEVLEVSSGGVREKAWKEWFTASWETTPAGVPVALTLTVSDSLRKAGTYDVVILLRPNLPRLKLQIVQAAAQLDVPEKLLIERTQNFPGVCCDVALPPLSVRESTGAAKVSGIQFFSRQPVQGNSGVSGSLVSTDPNVTVEAGEPKTIGYGLQGDFPRGTVTGSLKIVAPQLAQPVALAYEVRTKLHDAWVLFAIAFGLGLGYLVRVGMQNRIQLAQARAQADDIASQVTDHLADYDATVKAEIHDAHSNLISAAAGSNIAAITSSADALREKWKAALEAFQRRRTDASKLARGLEELLLAPRTLPAQAGASLTTARGSLTLANSLLGQHKADEALATLNSAYQLLAQDLRNVGLSWQSSAQGLQRLLADPETASGVPAVLQSQFAALLKNAPPELDRIKNDPLKPEIPLIQQALEDLSAELRGFSEVLLQFKLRGETEWALFESTWIASAAKLPDRGKLEALRQEFSPLLSEVYAAAADPAALREALPPKLANLQRSWETAIVNQLPPDHANRKDVRDLVAARKFVDAGTMMAAIVNNVQVKWGDDQQRDPDKWPAASLAAPTSHFITLFGTTEERRAAIPGLPRVAIEQQLRSAQLVQLAVVGALMVLWAFSSYVKDFDGTFHGLLAPFFATFLLDISVDGLKGQWKGKKGET